MRFHHVITRPDLARFEDRRFAEAWPQAQARFSTHVLGPHFEQLARDFTLRFASTATTGGPVARVGPAVINDAKARTQHELDVVATIRTPGGSSEVAAIGEAKHTSRVHTVADLDRLARIRTLLADRGAAPATTKLLLFSANGFDRHLGAAALERDDVDLIDLRRMYQGE